MSIADLKRAPQRATIPAEAARRWVGRSVSIDWLDLSSKNLDANGLLELAEFHFGKVFGRRGQTVLRDDELRYMAKGPLGMFLQADLIGSPNRFGEKEPWAALRLPGELCRAVGTGAVLDLVDAIAAAGGMNAARIDVALDDYEKTISPRQFAQACGLGRLDDESAELGPGVVTRVRRDNWEWSRRKGGCFWLGGRKSPRLLRVYDKDKESKGQIPSTRFELQSRDAFAVAMLDGLLAAHRAGEPIGGAFLARLVSFVDLREPCGSRSGSQKWQRIPWWKELTGDAMALPTLARDDSGVWEWIRAMDRQAGGYLAVRLKAEGLDGHALGVVAARSPAGAKLVRLLRSILGRADQALSPEHRVRLLQLQREAERASARTATAPTPAV
jgi:hypothetical protein